MCWPFKPGDCRLIFCFSQHGQDPFGEYYHKIGVSNQVQAISQA
jgi:hypothetical protein